MSDTLSRLRAIQQTAQQSMELPTVKAAQPPAPAELPSTPQPAPIGTVSAKTKGEILRKLNAGATTDALLLSLQAVADASGDAEFGVKARAATRPAATGEAWKRAFKVYSRFSPLIVDTAKRGDVDAACDLFGEAAEEVGEIFRIEGAAISEALATAVYEALSADFDRNRATSV